MNGSEAQLAKKVSPGIEAVQAMVIAEPVTVLPVFEFDALVGLHYRSIWIKLLSKKAVENIVAYILNGLI